MVLGICSASRLHKGILLICCILVAVFTLTPSFSAGSRGAAGLCALRCRPEGKSAGRCGQQARVRESGGPATAEALACGGETQSHIRAAGGWQQQGEYEAWVPVPLPPLFGLGQAAGRKLQPSSLSHLSCHLTV